MSIKSFLFYSVILLACIYLTLIIIRCVLRYCCKLFSCCEPHNAKGIRSKSKGYVYCLSNPSMPGIVKIGFTKNTPEMRAQQLYQQGGSGIPSPYLVEFYYYCKNPQQSERAIHKELYKRRVAKNREFFTVSIRKAKKTFKRTVPRPRTYYS